MGRLITLPFEDGLIIATPNGAVYFFEPAARHLWEALRAGWGVDDLVTACTQEVGLSATWLAPESMMPCSRGGRSVYSTSSHTTTR